MSFPLNCIIFPDKPCHQILILLIEFGSLRHVNSGRNPPEGTCLFSFLIKQTMLGGVRAAGRTSSQSRCDSCMCAVAHPIRPKLTSPGVGLLGDLRRAVFGSEILMSRVTWVDASVMVLMLWWSGMKNQDFPAESSCLMRADAADSFSLTVG